MENNKMKHHKKILMTAVLAASITSNAHAIETTITFDDITPAIFLGSSFPIGEITIEGIGRANPTGKFSFKVNPQTSPDYSGVFLQSGGVDFTGFKFSFDSVINNLSMNIGRNRTDWELTAYDLTGTQIGLSTPVLGTPFLSDNGGNLFSLTSSVDNISYVTLMNLGGPIFGNVEDLIRVDNLTYNRQAVLSPIPEPSTYALMLGGLGMVGFMAYRRRKTANA